MQDTEHPTPAAGSAGRRRVLLAVAVAVLVAGGTAFAALQGDDGTDAPPPGAGPAVTELTLPAASSAGRCMPVEPRTVAAVSTAFEGTVTEVEEGRVVLEASRWFVGGDADEVHLAVPDPDPVSFSLPGQPEFGIGERWLVTATDGRVNVCGFTAPWSPRLAGVFDEAFGG